MSWFVTTPKTSDNLTPEEMRARHKRAARETSALEIPHKKIALFLDRWVQQNFKSEGGKVGGWPPFAHGGRLRIQPGKPASFDPRAKLLQDTGRLRASFTPFSNKRTAGIGSDLSYSEKHEEGEGRLPQRRMLPRRKDVQAEVRERYRSHGVGAYKRRRLKVKEDRGT